MAKQDYAKPKQKLSHKKIRPKTHHHTSSYPIFGANTLLVAMLGVLGLLITLMLALNKLHLVPGAKKPTHHHTSESTPKKNIHQQSIAPKYDFYTLLPQNSDLEPTSQDPTPSVSTHLSHYVLQAASFTLHKDADKLRAQLILEGLNSYIEKTKTKGKWWYRVIVGPYTSKEKAQMAQVTLKKNNQLNSLLLEKE